MYETKRVNGFILRQKMDLSTDMAFYEDMNGQLLMTVDSGGTAFDKDGNVIGEFKLNYSTDHTWYFEGEDGTVINTPYKLLFEQVEPFVVEKLFNK